MSNEREYDCYKYVGKAGQYGLPINTVVSRINFKNKIVSYASLYNLLTTGFRQSVYTLSDEHGLVHYSFAIRRCFKYSFLCKQDVLISPCWTRADKRGQGIYPEMINGIASRVCKKKSRRKSIYSCQN